MIETLQTVSPEFLLVMLASAMYLAGTFAQGPCRWWSWIAIGGLGASGLALLTCGAWAKPDSSVVVADALATTGKLLALVTGLALVLLSAGHMLDETSPEYFASLLLVVAGMMLVAGANELVVTFLALELISIPTYVLLYLARKDTAAQESAVKYFFLSVFSSALFLYGLSFIYGAAGSTNLRAIAALGDSLPPETPGTLAIAMALVIGGLAFKVAAVPFHFYAPDVYQGTSNTLAALLAWAPKFAGFLAMLRLLTFSMPFLDREVSFLVWILAAITMTWGNVLGLLQNNLRRLLAYSSIAHAGYMLIGLGVGSAGGTQHLMASGAESVVFYLPVYAAMTIGAFAVIVYLSSPIRPVETVDDLSGLARTNPLVAMTLAVFLLSLTGIPITAGFWGKLAVFSSAIGSADVRYIWLAVIGVVNAAISSYYYLRIIGVMCFQESYNPFAPAGGKGTLGVIAGCALFTFLVGILPSPLLSVARRVAPEIRSRPDQMAAVPGDEHLDTVLGLKEIRGRWPPQETQKTRQARHDAPPRDVLTPVTTSTCDSW